MHISSKNKSLSSGEIALPAWDRHLPFLPHVSSYFAVDAPVSYSNTFGPTPSRMMYCVVEYAVHISPIVKTIVQSSLSIYKI